MRFFFFIQRLVGRAFSLDTRSLALGRMLMAIAILADLEQKSRFLEVFYTDKGILPRSALTTVLYQPYFYSLHMASGETWFQVLLFIIAAVFAILLFFGYKTRFVTIVSWLLLVSLQGRNLMILNAGDGILRLLVFWGMFLPLGAVWSVDRALDEGEKPPHQVISLGSVGLVVQVLMIYWVTVALRQSPEWLSEGSALYYALNIDQLTTHFGHWLSLQPLGILQILTWCAVCIESFAPLLLIIPDKRGIARFLGVLAGFTFHMGIFLMMHIGVFPFICMISWLLLLPGSFWDVLHRYLGGKRTGTGITMFYDAECGFCKKTVHLLRAFLALSDAQIAPANSEEKVQQRMLETHSWVVRQGEYEYGHWRGIVCVFAASPLFFWLAPILALKPVVLLGDALYRWIANHRQLLGRVTQHLQFRKQRWKLGWIGSALAAISLVLVLLWNGQVLHLNTEPVPMQAATLALRLDQYWNMFAPFPLKEDGWYVIPGTLVDGTVVDLMNNRDTLGVSYDKPVDLATTFPTESWRKYFLNLWLKDFEHYREYYAEYQCQRWNGTHTGDLRLKDVDIYFMKEVTPPPAQRGTEKPEKIQIWQWHCGGVTQ